MNPIHTIKNQYRGINAHLQSQLQSEGGWNSFHALHIADLTKALNRQLAPLGYEADIEQSLQIRRIDGENRYPESDVSIYERGGTGIIPPTHRQTKPASAQELVLPIPELLDLPEQDDTYHKAIHIYKIVSNRGNRGSPVVWIELLSPSNMPPHSDYESYRIKREMVLHGQIVFVEINYLHHHKPTFSRLPDYTKKQTDAHPYTITVIDPRPDFYKGNGHTHQFRVDDPIPTVTIPLNADDTIDFDFNAPYQRTFTDMLYGNRIDYRALPVEFERYDSTDQTRIANRMLAIIEAVSEGDDLEADTDLSAGILPLQDALQALRQHNAD